MTFIRTVSISARVLTAAFACITNAFAMQTDSVTDPKSNAWVELAAYGSTISRTPFWLHANQWGIVPTSGNVGTLRAGIEARKPLTTDAEGKAKWSVAYGAELVGNASAHSKLLIPQAYAGIAFRSFQLTIGRRKQFVGFNDNELGTGSYMLSLIHI